LESPVKGRWQYWFAVGELTKDCHKNERSERTCWVDYMLFCHFKSVYAKLDEKE
jgi:hypothetical protein